MVFAGSARRLYLPFGMDRSDLARRRAVRTHEPDTAAGPLRIIHVLPHVGSAQGGPVLSLALLAAAQASRGHRVTILASSLEQDGPPVQFADGVELIEERASRTFGFRRCPRLGARLAKLAGESDVVHSHLLWTDCHRQAARVCRGLRVPHAISPCGTLDKSALQHRGLKKWPTALWFQDRALHEAACLNAKSPHEAEAFRAYGLKNPIAMIANPIDYPGPRSDDDVGTYRRRHGLDREKSRVLFLGRLHPVKGLDRLVRAWAELDGFHDRWELVVAGPDENGYRRQVEETIRALGVEPSVRFTGMLHTEEKWLAIADSELLVLPSDFENFGVAAAEAMTSGRPVVTSNGTPWRHVVDAEAGWWVEKTPQALAEALHDAMTMPVGTLRAMGTRASELVRDYTPESITNAWEAVYRWIRGAGPKPACILD